MTLNSTLGSMLLGGVYLQDVNEMDGRTDFTVSSVEFKERPK